MCEARVGGANIPGLVDLENRRNPFGMRFRFVGRDLPHGRPATVAGWAVRPREDRSPWSVRPGFVTALVLVIAGVPVGAILIQRLHHEAPRPSLVTAQQPQSQPAEQTAPLHPSVPRSVPTLVLSVAPQVGQDSVTAAWQGGYDEGTKMGPTNYCAAIFRATRKAESQLGVSPFVGGALPSWRDGCDAGFAATH